MLQNRYRIIGNLAAGGMGGVYQAVDERLEALAAVKERFVQGVEIQRPFSREASLLANLSHSALPIVYDHFFEHDRQFLVNPVHSGREFSSPFGNNRPSVSGVGSPSGRE